jgi:predicted MFS family arabinose efflux permease
MKLWTGQSISEFGSQISALAIPWLAAVGLHATPLEFSLIGVLGFFPFILFALPAGVWVDRLRRRPILIVGDAGRAVLLAYVPIAWALGFLDIWQLLVLQFFIGVFTVFFDVAYQSYLPSLVEREQIVEGNSKLQTTVSAATIAGPGLSGALIAALTAPYAVAFDAVSFIISTAFMLPIRAQENLPERKEGEPKPRMLPELKEGVAYVVRHHYLKWIAMCTASSNFFGQIAFAIVVLFMARTLHISSFWAGAIFAGFGIGSIAGALSTTRFQKAVGVGRAIWIPAVFFSFATFLFPLAPESFPVPMLFAGTLVFGWAGMTYNITQVSLRQAITPARLQGRMNATMRWIVWGTIPLGNLAGGAIATAYSIRAALWVGAIGGAFTFLPVLLSPVRKIQEMPKPVDEPLPIEADAAGGIVEPTTSPLAGTAPADA